MFSVFLLRVSPMQIFSRERIVSVNTVRTQLQSIYRKLNVNDRRAAVEAARRLNLL